MNDVTYAQFDQVLKSLGFKPDEPVKGTRVYRHPLSEARITVPIQPDDQLVFSHHLVGARMILDAFGIADEPEFTSRLQKAG